MKTCLCGNTYETPFSKCPDCIEAAAQAHSPNLREMEAAQAQQQLQQARAAEWRHIVPLAYRKTDWTDPRLSPVCVSLAKTWWPAWDKEEQGLGIFGNTGLGKSRAAFAILTRLHFAGIPVHAVSAMQFAEASSSLHADERTIKHAARDLVHRCRTVRVLLLDDLGKDPPTQRTAAELHLLLEMRTANHLPLLWTSELTGEQLASTFADRKNNASAYADGIIRRLRGSCQLYEATPPQ